MLLYTKINLIILVSFISLYSCSTRGETGITEEFESDSLDYEDEQKIFEPILGERIDGPANVRDQPNGKAIFSIEDNVRVCSFHGTDWFDLELDVAIDKNLVENNFVKKGSKITDEKGLLICTMLVDLELENFYYNKGHGKFYGSLSGYTRKDNIKPESIIERNLEEYFNTIDNYTLESLMPFMSNFAFETPVSYPLPVDWKYATEQYLYSTGCFDYTESRLRFVFDAHELIAIIHDREINIEGFESIETLMGYDVIPIAEMSEEEQLIFVASVDSAYYGTE